MSPSKGPSRGYLELPPGWERVEAAGPGPFVTREVVRRPDGALVRWGSRAQRKGGAPARARAGVWWRPDRMSWRIGALFALGSLCFAAASITSQWAAAPRPGIGVMFFVGSLFFTSAAYLQDWEAVNVGRGPEHRRQGRRLRPASWEPHRIDWLAALVQLVGTLFFNVSTFAAMKHGFTTRQTDLRVWTPDVLGSICFLLASEGALAEVCDRWLCWRGRSLSWRIVALNLLGSVAFGASAIAALVVPSTDEPVNAAIANATTTLGALCFLAGALMLMPEAGHEEGPVVSSRFPS